MAGCSMRAILEAVDCPVCKELFTDPRILSCQHTFCFRCLQGYQTDTKPKNCPICRMETVPGKDQLIYLQPDKNISEMVAFIAVSRNDRKTSNKDMDSMGNKATSRREDNFCEETENRDSIVFELFIGGLSDRPSHSGLLCGNCGEVDKAGVLYKCCGCSDYHLCEKCHQLPRPPIHNRSHIFMKLKTPQRNAASIIKELQKDMSYWNKMISTGGIHTRSTCYKCGTGSITDLSYKCIICLDFDGYELCSSCESSAMNLHNEDHPLLVISHSV